MGARQNIYFNRHFAWLIYFTYHLVPVLVPNYKQHILSPGKVRKVCYSLIELYVKCIYLNLFVSFMKHFKWGGGARYTSFGTSGRGASKLNGCNNVNHSTNCVLTSPAAADVSLMNGPMLFTSMG
jgi:hypothetical protein